MDDSRGVNHVQRLAEVGSQGGGIQRPDRAGRDAIGQRPAVDVLHHEVRAVALRELRIEQRDQSRMAERGKEALLRLAPHRIAVLGRARPEDLDGDGALESLVEGAPDRTHAALADQLFEPIASIEQFTGPGGAGGRRSVIGQLIPRIPAGRLAVDRSRRPMQRGRAVVQVTRTRVRCQPDEPSGAIGARSSICRSPFLFTARTAT